MLRLPFVNADRSIAGYLHRVKDSHISQFDPMNVVRRASPETLPIQINEIIPRVKEGGAYIKFARQGTATLDDITNAWKKYLKESPIRPIFNPWRRVRGNLVKGQPWVEDLARFPSPKIKIEFLPTAPGNEAAELTEEQLFTLLRKYGKIADISPQPTDSKILPRYAMATFNLSRHAVMAKNCMHGFVLPESHGGGKTGTQLKIGYERIIKAHWIRDWITNHPRVVIPILAAILATIAVAIFDPIRTWFIKAHVTQQFHVSDSKIYRWVMRQISRANSFWMFGRRRTDDTSLAAIWDDRKDDIEQIKTWLMETADTFIVVQGPRGSGKKELVVDESLKGRPHSLIIDCKPIQEARGDAKTIIAAAKEVGYRPVFSWMNSFSSMIDLAAQGAIGTKTGFSETLDAQIAKIFANTSNALRQIALGCRKKDDKDADLGDDEWLEAHPEFRPAVVIDNFLHKSNESNVVYDKISEWAAALTTANIAHVIFLTHDVSFSKSLSKALPDRVFRQLSLGDTSPEVAKKFVIRHLDADMPLPAEDEGEKRLTPSQRRADLAELDSCIDVIGGRLTDLEFLARRIKTGESPNSASSLPVPLCVQVLTKNRSGAGNHRAVGVRDPQNVHSRPGSVDAAMDADRGVVFDQGAGEERHDPLQRSHAVRRLFHARRLHAAGAGTGRAHLHCFGQWPPSFPQARQARLHGCLPPSVQ
jgi:RNA12 protein